MLENELQKTYFDWMYQLVCTEEYTRDRSYHRLLSYLYELDFIALMERDLNRIEDGIDLRYRFSYETGTDKVLVATYLDNRPCSILEMMIALAIRCEETMSSPDIEDRTDRWFWEMIDSLGLTRYDDYVFDGPEVDYILTVFQNREYKPNGKGGLFTIENCKRDLRNVEIWYQMGWHLNELIEKGE